MTPPIFLKFNRLKEKLNTFSNIVKEIAELSTSSNLKVGCIAVKTDFSRIASIGYNGSYSNAPIYENTGTEEESLEKGLSGFIHAEINLVAKFKESDPENYFILITHSPCNLCTKVLVNAGFKYIYWLNEYRSTDHLEEIFKRTNCHGCNINMIC